MFPDRVKIDPSPNMLTMTKKINRTKREKRREQPPDEARPVRAQDKLPDRWGLGLSKRGCV